MKIVCENCAAKYSIADEKVKGKAFKIRCKKCGESIVVRGDSLEPAPPPKPSEPPAQEPEAATKAFDYSGHQESGGAEQAVWHIVVDGQQQGPYTANQILEFQKAGSLSNDSYVWQEGFDDWKPIKEVPELYVESNQTPPAADGEKKVMQAGPAGLLDAKEPEPMSAAPAGDGNGGLFDQPTDDGGGLFSSDDQAAAAASSSPFDSGGGGLFGQDGDKKPADDVFSSTQSPPEPDGGGLFSADTAAEPGPATTGDDLFGGGGAESDGDDLFGSVGEEAGPHVSAEEIMTGQRSENSVLFSLSNLQALAASPQPQASEQPQMGGAMIPSATSVTEEASGLIDIRSLAGSLSDQKDATGVEDLISMSGGGFAPSLGAPVLAPQKESMSLGTKIGIIGGSVVVLAVIVVLAVMVLSPDKSPSDDQIKQLQEELASLKVQGSGTSVEADAIKQQLANIKQQSSVVKEDPTTSEDRVAKADEPSSKPKASSSSSSSKSSTSSSKSSTPTKKSTSTTSRKSSSSTSSTSKKKASSELDDLLGPGIGGTAKKKRSTSSSKSSSSSSTSTTKAKLSRSDVQKGMNSVAGRVKNCGQGKSGTITLKVVIGSSGRVVSATPTGAFAGTPIGSCAVRAVKSARFPKAASSLTVKYPFRL
jgi:predicted Zn finger-like uncharacterized protein